MVANQDQDAETASPAATAVVLMQLASRWRSPGQWNAAAEELEAETAPSELNTVNSSGLFAAVSTDKMSVSYLGTAHHGHDVGVVQADRPAPTHRAVYYFEMRVRSAGQKGRMSIGFTNEGHNMRRQPG
jgi:Ran-binding protein 9/10